MDVVVDIKSFFGNNKRAKIKETTCYLICRPTEFSLLEPPLIVVLRHSPIATRILHYIRWKDRLSLRQINSFFYRVMHFKFGFGSRILNYMENVVENARFFRQESLDIIADLYNPKSRYVDLQQL